LSGIQGILKQLFSAYPNTQVTPETVAVYLRLLADFAPADLQVIVDQAVATCKFLPTVAELRDMRHAMEAMGELSWGEAWEDVQKEMRRIGSYGVPQFRTELTAAVVRSMGWKTLCASENPQTDRAQFRDIYNAMQTRQGGVRKLLPQAREWSERNGGLAPIGETVKRIAANGNTQS